MIENTIKMSSKSFPIVFLASSMLLCQGFRLMNEWDGIQSLVNAINEHNKAYLKEKENGDWLEEENGSLSEPFDDKTENYLGSETDLANVEKRQLTSSELNKLRNMEFELENDMTHKNNSIKQKLDNIAFTDLDNFEMKRRETLVTLPNLNDSNENNAEYENMDIKNQNYKDMLDVVANQLHVVENFVDYLKEEKKVGRQGKSEFEDILDSIKNKTTAVKQTTEATTSDVPEVPMITLIDEKDIRDALQNDPLVKRIVKLAKKKRGQYMKDLENGVA